MENSDSFMLLKTNNIMSVTIAVRRLSKKASHMTKEIFICVRATRHHGPVRNSCATLPKRQTQL